MLYHSVCLNIYLLCINEFIQVLFISDRFPRKDICLPNINNVHCLIEYGAHVKNIDKHTVLNSIYKFINTFGNHMKTYQEPTNAMKNVFPK